MAVLSIKRYPDPILRQRAKEVTTIRQRTLNLIANMIETMYANEGIGLAANQVGVLQRILVANLNPRKESNHKESYNQDNVIALINPQILAQEGEETAEEGCLSFPEIRGKIKRAARVRAKGLNVKGEEIEVEASGLPARVIQHEIDHLNGVLFIDRMNQTDREAIKDKLTNLKKRYKR